MYQYTFVATFMVVLITADCDATAWDILEDYVIDKKSFRLDKKEPA